MATNIKLVALLIIIYFIATNSTCKKNCSEQQYSFTLNAKAFPDLDSIKVSDTLWIEINESSILKDLLSGTQTDFSGAANLSTAISFQQLLGSGQSKDAALDFNYKVVNGTIVSNNPNASLIREYKLAEAGGRYLLRLGVVPTKQGIYRIGLGNAANVYLNTNNCSKASFTINFFQTNQHMYYNEINFGVVIPLPNGGYCFKVK